MELILPHALALIFLVTGAACFENILSDLETVSTVITEFKCTEEGRFPHPQDCGGYVECLRDFEGNFKRRFGTCHGGVFSADVKSCLTSVEDYECKRLPRKTRALATGRRYSGICSEVRNTFVCADCKTVVNCVEGVAYTENCGTGDMCDERLDFGGAVCYPTPFENCTCSSPNDFFMDAYDRQMFFFCDNVGAEPDLYHCPEDMQFDVESKQCSNQYDLHQCMETGVFPVYSNCSQYYTCIASKEGWVQKPFSCENDFMYNEDTGICEDPCSWDTGDFTCQEEGRFTDPLSCHHYYECAQVGESFRQERRQCPDGYEWDPTALIDHGHCVKDSNNNCNPMKVSKCLIPEGQCAAAPAPAAAAALSKKLHCHEGWHLYEDSCYFFGISEVTWLEGREECLKMNGDYVKVTSDDEFEFIRSNISQNSYIGLNDIETEGVYEWISDGTGYTDKNNLWWHAGQPDDYHNEDCIHYWFQNDKILWNDFPCTSKMGFICEMTPTDLKVYDLVFYEDGNTIPDVQLQH